MTFEELMDAFFVNKYTNNRKTYEHLLEDMKRGVVPVIGAGLSVWAEYPLWSAFLKELSGESAEAQKLLAQEKYEEAASALKRDIPEFMDILEEAFSPKQLDEHERPSYQALLPKLFKGPFVTTNYDLSLERLLKEEDCAAVNPNSRFSEDEIRNFIMNSKRILVKLHGSVRDPKHMILTKESYDDAYGSDPDAPDGSRQLPKTLRIISETHHILFLGCSLGNDRTCRVLKTFFGANGYALVELPDKTAGEEAYQKELKERRAYLTGMHLKVIWYPHKQHEAVGVLLTQLAEDMKSNAPSPVTPPHACQADIEAAQYPKADNFIEREKEVDRIIGYFRNDGARTVLVHGAPGIGKTEVCKAVYRKLRAADPQFSMPFVDAVGSAGIADMTERIAVALGMSLNNVTPGELFDRLHEHVIALCRSGARYLYLDNFEEACDKLSDDERASLYDRLIRLNSAGLRLLISSQIKLPFGRPVSVEPLDGSQPVTGLPWDEFCALDRVTLFLNTLGRKPRQNEHAALVTLMHEIGGHPLALVLTATYGRTCGSVAELLDDWYECECTTAGLRKSQQSLRRALTLAWRNVRQTQAAVFLWAVHAHSVLPLDTETIKDLNAILPEPFKDRELREGGRVLRAFGLLSSTDDGKEQMLLSVKKPFVSMGDEAKRASVKALAAWIILCGDLLEQGDNQMLSDQQSRHDRALALLPQCFSLAEYCLDNQHYGSLAFLLRRAYNFYQFDRIRSIPLLQRLLRETPEDFPLRAVCYCRLGDLFCFTGQLEDAQKVFDEAEQLCRQDQNPLGLANVLRSRGDLFYYTGQLEAAQKAYDEAEQFFRKIQNALGLANVLQSRGDLFCRTGQWEAAQTAYDEAEKLCRKEQYHLGLANVLQACGDLFCRTGQWEAAQKAYDEAEQFYRKKQNNLGLANVLQSRGDLFCRTGQWEAAQKVYDEAEQLYRQVQDALGLANVLFSRGALLLVSEDVPGAASSYEQALTLYRQEQEPMGLCYTLSKLLFCKKLLGDEEGYQQCLRELEQLLPQQPENVQETIKKRIAQAETVEPPRSSND